MKNSLYWELTCHLGQSKGISYNKNIQVSISVLSFIPVVFGQFSFFLEHFLVLQKSRWKKTITFIITMPIIILSNI